MRFQAVEFLIQNPLTPVLIMEVLVWFLRWIGFFEPPNLYIFSILFQVRLYFCKGSFYATQFIPISLFLFLLSPLLFLPRSRLSHIFSPPSAREDHPDTLIMTALTKYSFYNF